MEFRFLAPVMPCMFLLIQWSVLRVFGSTPARAATFALIFAGSIHHQMFFGETIPANCIASPRRLLDIPDASSDEPVLWSELEVGRYLGAVFDHDPGVKIGVGAAGIIPFYSRLGALDILGLNDAWISRNGRLLRFDACIGGFYPAHVRIATGAYLVEQGVHLFIGPGALVRDDRVEAIDGFGALIHEMFLEDAGLAESTGFVRSELPPETRLVKIPVRPGYKLLALYITPDASVDQAIDAHGWGVIPVASLAGR